MAAGFVGLPGDSTLGVTIHWMRTGLRYAYTKTANAFQWHMRAGVRSIYLGLAVTFIGRMIFIFLQAMEVIPMETTRFMKSICRWIWRVGISSAYGARPNAGTSTQKGIIFDRAVETEFPLPTAATLV